MNKILEYFGKTVFKVGQVDLFWCKFEIKKHWIFISTLFGYFPFSRKERKYTKWLKDGIRQKYEKYCERMKQLKKEKKCNQLFYQIY